MICYKKLNQPLMLCSASSIIGIDNRCWNYSDTVGTLKDDPTICDRCEAALKGEF